MPIRSGIVTDTTITFIRLPEVLERVGMSKAHVYRLIGRGEFPKPIKPTGQRMSRWSDADITAWQKARMAA